MNKKTLISEKQVFEKIFAIDTNVILEDFGNLVLLSEGGKNLISIPIEVIEEIDKFKTKEGSSLAYMARRFSHIVEDEEKTETIFVKKDIGFYLERKKISVDGTFIILDIYKTSKYKDEMSERDKDIQIILSIKEISHFYVGSGNVKNYSNIFFISLDNNARIRARAEGLKSQNFIGIKNKKINDLKETIPLIKEFSVKKRFDKTPNIFEECLPHLNICKKELNEVKKYNYPVISINHGGKGSEYFVKAQSTYKRLLDDDFKTFVFKPKNLWQKIFAKTILEENDIVVCEGDFGSGKTMTAFSAALELKNRMPNKYQKILYIRKTIISEDRIAEIGFLPGSKEEKLAPYIQPLRDTIEQIILEEESKKNKKSNKPVNIKKIDLLKKVEEFENDNNIDYEYQGFLRGRSLKNTIVIFDEAQNSGYPDLKLIASRLGENCVLIALGSLSQIDNPFLNKNNNALARLYNDSFHSYEEIGVNIARIKLQSIIRGKIAKYAQTITFS